MELTSMASRHPQDAANLESWAAKFVLESKPRLLREFWLRDVSAQGIAALQTLKEAQPKVRGRTIEVVSGDFNQTVKKVLARSKITDNTASFCLLDQRTFECEWATVRTLAAHKRTNKLELFYFLASGWLDRSLAGTKKNAGLVERWWGRTDWEKLRGMATERRAELLRSRFCEELGYAHAYTWPIF
jgi:three-Cys-motif partner protein